MKIYQEEEDKGFVEKAQIKGECGCLLYLENENKIISGDRTGTISIYKENDKIPNKYEKIQTLSHHEKQINSLAIIPGNKIVSVGFDCRIIIWKQSEDNRYFNPAQIITIDKPIAVVISLFDSRIVFTCDDGPIHIYKEKDPLENMQYEKCEYIEEQILNDESKGNKQHRGRVCCLCQLNNSYIVSGGADKSEKVGDNNKNKKEHYIVVWRPENEKYICSQILKDHKASLTCIIQLRDGNFASSSYDRTVKIWKPVKNENKIYMYTLLNNLTDYTHGIHMIIQLKDDRLCGTSSKNQIVLWRNRSGSY
jgi:WD40 repeat protein